MYQSPTETDPRTYSIIGAAMEVHRQLGCGFVEPIYQEAMQIELAHRNIPCEREFKLQLYYKGKELSSKFSVDFFCFGAVVVELKALQRLSGTEESQVLNYLKAAGLEVGLLINFGTQSLQHRRFVFSKPMQTQN